MSRVHITCAASDASTLPRPSVVIGANIGNNPSMFMHPVYLLPEDIQRQIGLTPLQLTGPWPSTYEKIGATSSQSQTWLEARLAEALLIATKQNCLVRKVLKRPPPAKNSASICQRLSKHMPENSQQVTMCRHMRAIWRHDRTHQTSKNSTRAHNHPLVSFLFFLGGGEGASLCGFEVQHVLFQP